MVSNVNKAVVKESTHAVACRGGTQCHWPHLLGAVWWTGSVHVPQPSNSIPGASTTFLKLLTDWLWPMNGSRNQFRGIKPGVLKIKCNGVEWNRKYQKASFVIQVLFWEHCAKPIYIMVRKACEILLYRNSCISPYICNRKTVLVNYFTFHMLTSTKSGPWNICPLQLE